ncbi:MAG: hypothetical protein ACR2OM_04800 [Aestuariivirgaceae bacterium]
MNTCSACKDRSAARPQAGAGYRKQEVKPVGRKVIGKRAAGLLAAMLRPAFALALVDPYGLTDLGAFAVVRGR